MMGRNTNPPWYRDEDWLTGKISVLSEGRFSLDYNPRTPEQTDAYSKKKTNLTDGFVTLDSVKNKLPGKVSADDRPDHQADHPVNQSNGYDSQNAQDYIMDLHDINYIPILKNYTSSPSRPSKPWINDSSPRW